MKVITFCFMGLMFFLSSCLSETQKPKDPIWGKESCARCRMVLSEKRYAVQRVFSSGEVHFYDDLNCALSHKHEGSDEGILYVRPFGGEEWMKAQDARYQGGLMTPMNSGFGAVKEGGALSFGEVQQKIKGQ